MSVFISTLIDASEKKEDLSKAVTLMPSHSNIIDYAMADLESQEVAGVLYTKESIEKIQQQKATLRKLKATKVRSTVLSWGAWFTRLKTGIKVQARSWFTSIKNWWTGR